MYTFLIVVHIFISFLMVGSILLQSGKGAEIGAAFGGASQTIFGSRGPGTFLSKVTVGAAIVFMLTSISLAVLSKERSLFSVTNVQEGVETPVDPEHPMEDQTPPDVESKSTPTAPETPEQPQENPK